MTHSRTVCYVSTQHSFVIKFSRNYKECARLSVNRCKFCVEAEAKEKAKNHCLRCKEGKDRDLMKFFKSNTSASGQRHLIFSHFHETSKLIIIIYTAQKTNVCNSRWFQQNLVCVARIKRIFSRQSWFKQGTKNIRYRTALYAHSCVWSLPW